MTAEEKRRAKIGLARVDMSLCRLSEGRECDRCARICPYRAIDIRWSGYAADIRIEPARCPGCGACQLVCPTSPRKAITVEPVGPPNDIRRRFPRAESSQPFSA